MYMKKTPLNQVIKKIGLEGTHYACQEMTEKGVNGMIVCCECTNHNCKPSHPTTEEGNWEREFEEEFREQLMKSFAFMRVKFYIRTLLAQQRQDIEKEWLQKISDEDLKSVIESDLEPELKAILVTIIMRLNSISTLSEGEGKGGVK